MLVAEMQNFQFSFCALKQVQKSNSICISLSTATKTVKTNLYYRSFFYLVLFIYLYCWIICTPIWLIFMLNPKKYNTSKHFKVWNFYCKKTKNEMGFFCLPYLEIWVHKRVRVSPRVFRRPKSPGLLGRLSNSISNLLAIFGRLVNPIWIRGQIIPTTILPPHGAASLIINIPLFNCSSWKFTDGSIIFHEFRVE